MYRRLLLATNNWAGTDRVYLDTVAITGNHRFETCYPGGPSLATWTVDMPATASHRALLPGRKVELFNGATLVWAGRLDDPKRGEPWECSAVGIGSLATTFTAAYWDVNGNIDGAINRGLPWTRPADMNTDVPWTVGNGTQRLDEALTTSLTAAGKAWRVAPAGVVSSEAWPTAVTHQVWPANVPPSTFANYYTTAMVTFHDSATTTSTTTVTNTAAVARFGYVEVPLDLTALGTLTAGWAAYYAQYWLDRQSAALTFTEPLILRPGQVRAVGGGAVDLLSVRAGHVAQVMVTDPSHSPLRDPTKPIQGVVAKTSYDAITEELTLSFGEERRDDLFGILADSWYGTRFGRA